MSQGSYDRGQQQYPPYSSSPHRTSGPVSMANQGICQNMPGQGMQQGPSPDGIHPG